MKIGILHLPLKIEDTKNLHAIDRDHERFIHHTTR